MTEDPRKLLEDGLAELKFERTAAIAPSLLNYAELLLTENARTNLTGVRSLPDLIRNHILDSLAPLSLLDLADPVVDMGSGGGLPGIPAAIAYPSRRFILLEPRAKRAEFLQFAIQKLGLRNSSVVKSSARGPGASALVGSAGTILARAVAVPKRVLELGLPLLRPGGTLLLYEGRSAKPTDEQKNVASKLGGSGIVVKRVRVPGLGAVRHAWMVRRRVETRKLARL